MQNYMDYIEVNPNIMFGKPVVKGTRITVESILEDLAAGKTADDVVSTYLNLKPEDIQAALRFAADSLRGERVYSLAV